MDKLKLYAFLSIIVAAVASAGGDVKPIPTAPAKTSAPTADAAPTTAIAPTPAPAQTPDKPAAKKPSDIERIQQQISTLKIEYTKRDQDYIKAIDTQVDKIEKLLNSREEWTKDTDGEGRTNGLGEIEQLRLRATFFSIERGFRKEVEREIRDLIKLMREWTSSRTEFKERMRILTLEERVIILESKETTAADATPVRKEDYEYYEVKTESTLSQISALPELYGDPSMWRLIFNANKDKIPDPEKPIPAGTVLVVPEMLK